MSVLRRIIIKIQGIIILNVGNQTFVNAENHDFNIFCDILFPKFVRDGKEKKGINLN